MWLMSSEGLLTDYQFYLQAACERHGGNPHIE